MPSQESVTTKTICSRPACLPAGVSLILLGLFTGAYNPLAQADPTPPKQDVPKKESVEEIEKEVQKALEALRKGQPSVPRREQADSPVQGEKRKPANEDAKPPVQGEKRVPESIQGVLKAGNGEKNTITLTLPGPKGQPPEDRTFDVDKEAKITIDKSRVSKLSDLTPGARITLTLGLDLKSAVIVHATTPRPEVITVNGVLTEVDAAKGKLMVAVSKRKGQPPEPQSFSVPNEAKVLIDLDKAAKLSDLKAGVTVAVEITADQKVVAIRATGGSLFGVLKAADVDSGKVTVTMNPTKAAPGEDKEFTVAKEAKFWLGKQPVELAQLPAGAKVTMSLSIDEKTVIGARFETK